MVSAFTNTPSEQSAIMKQRMRGIRCDSEVIVVIVENSETWSQEWRCFGGLHSFFTSILSQSVSRLFIASLLRFLATFDLSIGLTSSVDSNTRNSQRRQSGYMDIYLRSWTVGLDWEFFESFCIHIKSYRKSESQYKDVSHVSRFIVANNLCWYCVYVSLCFFHLLILTLFQTKNFRW